MSARLATTFRGARTERALHPRIQSAVDALNDPAILRADATGQILEFPHNEVSGGVNGPR